MKKTLLIILACFFSFQGLAQDPDLYQTWHLESMQSEDFNITIPDITPLISPLFTLTETLEFSGEGACNTFTGVLSYNSDYDYFTITSFFSTEYLCEYTEHNDFEDYYFGYFWVDGTLYYDIYTEPTTGVQYLSLEIPIFAGMYFRNVPLSIPDYNLDNFTIFPNPVSNQLFISSENIIIEKMIVYSLTGKKVLEASKGVNSIDVSNLSKGMYFIEIYSDAGKTVKKFITK